MNNTGFVAGTLIHTDKGLVPIQHIKVGDMVLSRDEHNPDGELAYKRVLNTFVSTEKQRIFSVVFETVRNDMDLETFNPTSLVAQDYGCMTTPFLTNSINNQNSR
ncbi:polymorphic toxin-type HINT domain-containing protein [Psychrobacter sp.]|uniref:polymorphic toxin-type HINT domain-containing protein n=1 Tax=Psychrobacter sp. TaxID=56811 RepID=UPI003C75DBA3